MDRFMSNNGTMKKKRYSKRRRLIINNSTTKRSIAPRNQSLRLRVKPPKLFSKTSVARYRELQGILDVMSSFPKKDNYQSDMIRDVITLMNKKRLSIIDIAHMKYGENYNIGTDDYWIHIIGILDDMIDEYKDTLHHKIKDMTDKLYVSSTSTMIKELAILNETDERINKLYTSHVPEPLDQKAKYKECILNAIEINKSLDEVLILKLYNDGGYNRKPHVPQRTYREKMSKLNNTCDIIREYLENAIDLIDKISVGSPDIILEKVRNLVEQSNDHLISTQHLFSKIDI